MSATKFTIDYSGKHMIAEREFNAPLDLVWKAWTDASLLNKWWAPRPWEAVTKHMNFREGGSWLYCMQGPQGEKHWGKMSYVKISVKEFFDAEDVFCDEDGNVNHDLPGTVWRVTFSESGTGTIVKATTIFTSIEAMKQLIEMGVQEGSKMAHSNLDEVLEGILSETEN